MKCPYCGAKSDTNRCPSCFAEIPIPVKQDKKDENKDNKEKET